MSVIPFITNRSEVDGKVIEKTVTSIKDEFKRDGFIVLIEDIDPEQAADFKNKESKDANTSYDLTVGAEYIDLRDRSKHGITEESPIRLSPGAAVIIETAE